MQFTASRELRDKLERLRALRRSTIPDGDLAAIIEVAVTNDLAGLERRTSARTDRDAQGRRCSARVWLEHHHRQPYGLGGDHSVDNVSLLCRAHNRYLEEIDYGSRGCTRLTAARRGGP